MLNIDSITVQYGEQTILKDLSLSCREGQIHGILGINGSGKTTLFKSIYGIKKTQKGSITFNNSTNYVSKTMYLETDPYFYPYMKGNEYLEITALKNPHFRMDAWNEVFNLPLNDYIDTYSSGMKKKIALLGGIALNRTLLLLDEPFNNLDVKGIHHLDHILKALKRAGKCIVFTSHRLPSLKTNCDKISLLINGAIEHTYSRSEFDALEKRFKHLMDDDSQKISSLIK